MSNPTPLSSDPWPSEPSRAARQVHAVLAWLVVEADVPNDVYLHLVDALLAWAPLMGEHLFPTEPDAGVDADLHRMLEGLWWRLDEQAADARWADKVVLNEVRGRVGLAMRARGPGARLPLVCRHLGHREAEGPRAAGPLATRCGGASLTLIGPCLADADTAAVARMRRCRTAACTIRS